MLNPEFWCMAIGLMTKPSMAISIDKYEGAESSFLGSTVSAMPQWIHFLICLQKQLHHFLMLSLS